MSNDQTIENEIQAKGLTAPRITFNQVENEIASESYFTAADGVRAASEGKPGASLLPEYVTYPGSPLSMITICVLIMRNGHRIVGVNEGPVSDANFDAEIGRKLAREDAVAKIWPLLGFRLRDTLASEPTDFIGRMRAEADQLTERMVKLEAFFKTDTYLALPGEAQRLVTDQHGAMAIYRRIVHRRIELATA